MPEDQTQASAWFLGVSTTCEVRHLQPTALLPRLPSISTLELVLVGFLGEKDPQNKTIPDSGAEKLTQGEGACQRLKVDDRRVVIRAIKGTLQDALKKELKPIATAIEASAEKDVPSAAAAADALAAAGENVESASAEASTSAEEAPPVEEAGANEEEKRSKQEEAPSTSELMLPSVCFIAHPQLHRYFSDFHPAIAWLIEKKVPTIIIGASEPDPSWKQDEALLKALGANIVVSKRESPYPMCLPDNAQVKKCNHIIGFAGGKALPSDKLTRTKIDLLAQDYNVR